MIPGLTYIKDFISQELSDQILAEIEQQSWSNSLKRRVQQYGYRYDYTKKQIDTQDYLGELPKFFSPIIEKLDFVPDQIIVNEYLLGQGISKHTDHQKDFGPKIASLSLLSSAKMIFEKYDFFEKKSLLLEPLSLLFLEDEVRYQWMHSIPAVTERRISITFRTVIHGE